MEAADSAAEEGEGELREAEEEVVGTEGGEVAANGEAGEEEAGRLRNQNRARIGTEAVSEVKTAALASPFAEYILRIRCLSRSLRSRASSTPCCLALCVRSGRGSSTCRQRPTPDR